MGLKSCKHCGESFVGDEDFCCLGCSTAYKIINKLGFNNYYKLRQLDPKERKIKPELEEEIAITKFIKNEENNIFSISLMVQGLHCAACVWLIENILKKQKNVLTTRINLSKKTLFLRWKGDVSDGENLTHLINQLGYKLLPFDQKIINNAEKKYSDSILRALAVAGFGAGNVMLISLSLWFSDMSQMGENMRNLLYFFSALIALPVIVFSSRPFFISAYNSVKRGYPNMDLAISIAISLISIVSLIQTFEGANHIYFDSAVMLIFFLLIGRYLDLKARKKAFRIATEFTLLAASFGRVEHNNKVKIIPSQDLKEGMILLVATGEKIAADGVVIDGESEIDTALITGETMPKKVTKGCEVYAGTINMGPALQVKITKTANNSLLSKIIALSQKVENNKNYYVRLSDKLAKFYIPIVHILALATFALWYKLGWQVALTNATAVLIITCPCALALAIPIVQTIAISNFIKNGVLVKSGDALEKLPKIDVIVFDKTGSLTIGAPKLVDVKLLNQSDITNYHQLAASLAKNSKHPISKAILESYDGNLTNLTITEKAGLGIEANYNNQILRLGRKDFCNIKSEFVDDSDYLKSFAKFGDLEMVFFFEDATKTDAKTTIKNLQKIGKEIILLSGDSKKAVTKTAQELAISNFHFEKTPIAKVEFLKKLKAKSKSFIMVGDGLNDAPALALSDVSISFCKASDISQNIADIVIQGQKLQPINNLIKSSNKSISLMKQNLAIALIYNLIAIPYAISGNVVPLVAALAMSSSSLLVLFNSLRMAQK